MQLVDYFFHTLRDFKYYENEHEGIHYEGEIEGEKRHGKGSLKYFAYKEEYDYLPGENGEILDERWDLREIELHYKGEFVDNQMNGFGELTLPNGMRYEGDFKGNAPHGMVLLRWPSRKNLRKRLHPSTPEDTIQRLINEVPLTYEGDMFQGYFIGRGILTYQNSQYIWDNIAYFLKRSNNSYVTDRLIQQFDNKFKRYTFRGRWSKYKNAFYIDYWGKKGHPPIECAHIKIDSNGDLWICDYTENLQLIKSMSIVKRNMEDEMKRAYLKRDVAVGNVKKDILAYKLTEENIDKIIDLIWKYSVLGW